MHGGSLYSYGKRYKNGDIIGCFMDANEKTLSKGLQRVYFFYYLRTSNLYTFSKCGNITSNGNLMVLFLYRDSFTDWLNQKHS